MPVLTGLDCLMRDGFASLQGQRVILLTNQAAVARDYTHSLDAFRNAGIEVVAVFGPQHGVWGHTQDNMVEWDGYTDARTGIPFYSLYGEARIPKEEWFQGADHLVVDIVDVGTRVYTFIWTMAYCLEVAARLGVPVTVLDRPNPITSKVEGPNLDSQFRSFVGLYDIPLRHGRTTGEIASWLRHSAFLDLRLNVVWCEGWNGRMKFVETGLPWVPPSPNMPNVTTAVVYPGAVLFEGTNMSEGRGTTRPFETIGAPWLNPWLFAAELNAEGHKGVIFRPITFQPTSQKHAGTLCGGVFLHIVDCEMFEPVRTAVHILSAAFRVSDGEFRFNSPPYEYEEVNMPIDILWGNSGLRTGILAGESAENIAQSCSAPRNDIAKQETYL